MSNHDREGSHPSNRDTPLERAWREVSDEQPPAHLDAAIIAAARQSVADNPQSTTPPRTAARRWQTQWQPLAAAATVAGLAFVLVQMLPREHSVATSTQRQESAPVTTAVPPPQSSQALEATDNSRASVIDQPVDARDRVDGAAGAPAREAIPAPPATPAAPAQSAVPAVQAEATASDTADLAGASSADRREAVAPESAGRTAPVAAAAPSAKAMSSEQDLDHAVPLDAPAWAAKIAALHAADDVAAAEQALRAFRAARPDADSYLPDSLRDWARSVH